MHESRPSTAASTASAASRPSTADSQTTAGRLALADPDDDVRWSPRGAMALAAMFPLAMGPGTPHDSKEKKKLLVVNAGRDSGKSSALAWLKLGRAHAGGVGTKQDLREALHCFEEASLRGEPFGALEAGNLLNDGGPGFNRDRNRAIEFYKKATEGEKKVPEALRRLGEVHLALKTPAAWVDALRYFTDGFEADPLVNPGCGMAAARMLSCGLGCLGGEPDLKRAKRLLVQAADKGKHGAARVRLAVMYDLGVGGVEQDPAKAREYWKRGALSDLAEAHYRCGVLALHGAGFVKSERAAVNGFRRAAKLGFPTASARLRSLRGDEAADAVVGHRAPNKDFLDTKFQEQCLYPYPFYEDEIIQAALDAEEEKRRAAEEAEDAREAAIAALMTGGSKAVLEASKKRAGESKKWLLPPLLEEHMKQERAELMRCLDDFERHRPTQYASPPPKPRDRVRDFFGNTGMSGLEMRTVATPKAIGALGGEGAEGLAYSRGIEGYRNKVFEEQGLSRLLGVTRKSASAPLSTKPTSLGHANMQDVEARLYTAKAKPDSRFLSSAALQGRILKASKRSGKAKAATEKGDLQAVVTVARGLPPVSADERRANAKLRALQSASASPSGQSGGKDDSKKTKKDGSATSRALLANAAAAREAARAQAEPPAWMYDTVWMARPLAQNPAMSRAIELRRNYGAPPRLGTARAMTAAGRSSGSLAGTGRRAVAS